MLRPYKRAELNFAEIREIGADGRNSKTHLVRDAQLGAEIVMKTIAKADLIDPAEFFDEAKHLYATAHQNVVQIHYACEDADSVYIAMPFYIRGSVKGLMAASRLTVREIIRLGCQLLCGVHNIHSKGLIHFDIKPDNVLLSKRSEALLSDFGLAKQMQLGFAQPNGFYLKMAPPEAVGGPPYDLRFDIYQIGLTLYRMINGNDEFYRQFAPFYDALGNIDRPALAAAITAGAFPDRQAFGEHVQVKLRRVVAKCLEPNPLDRYPSALAVANALAAIDECLDWRPVEDPVNKIWIKNENGTEKRFVVNSDGSTEFTTTALGGAARRKRDLCKARMTRREIEGTLKSN
ncbi:serine/threonine-protein kinase [Bosea sp. UC22_33]|uniref:serine/threonine-protein kinase n=1 Tax=Bosea sp. UC22_33 TaxID=3350165 RepID=UPI00366FEE9A